MIAVIKCFIPVNYVIFSIKLTLFGMSLLWQPDIYQDNITCQHLCFDNLMLTMTTRLEVTWIVYCTRPILSGYGHIVSLCIMCKRSIFFFSYTSSIAYYKILCTMCPYFESLAYCFGNALYCTSLCYYYNPLHPIYYFVI